MSSRTPLRGYTYEPLGESTYRVLSPERVELGTIMRVHLEREGRVLTYSRWLAYPVDATDPLQHEGGDLICWSTRYDAALALLQELGKKEISNPES